MVLKPYVWKTPAGILVSSGAAYLDRYRGNVKSNIVGSNVSSDSMAMKRAGRSYTKTSKRRKRGMYKGNSFVKKVTQTQPAKHFNYNFGQTLTKGAMYVWSPTQAVIRGTNDDQRVGDTIYLAGLKFNGLFNTNNTASAYQYRFIIGFTGEEFAASTLATGVISSNQVFQSNTSSPIITNGLVNPKAFTVVYDEKIIVNSVLSGVADAQPLVGTITFNDKKFLYQSDGSTYGKLTNLVVIVMGDDVMGSAAANAGGCSMSFDFIFR